MRLIHITIEKARRDDCGALAFDSVIARGME